MTGIEKRLRCLSIITILTLVGILSVVYVISNSSRYLNRPSSNIDTDGLGLHNDQRKPPIKHDPSDVLILTYMRSGSTFLGKLLGWREDAFYCYEPMWKTHTWVYLSSDHLMCDYRKPECEPISGNTSVSVDRTLKFLLDIYKCANLIQYCGRAVRIRPTDLAYQKCMRVSSSPGKSPESRSRTACLEPVPKRCVRSKHKVLKVLRLETTHAQFLLERHEQLKLVQSFRDPRAVIYSRIKSNWYYKKVNTIEDDIQVLCKRMSNDIEAIEKLRPLYPERVKIVQYEDFYDPRRLAINLYSFLNMEMSESVERLLQTFEQNDKTGVAGFHPDSYRSRLDWNIIQSTTKYCRSVLHRLGLRIFESEEELRNISLNIISGSLPFKID